MDEDIREKSQSLSLRGDAYMKESKYKEAQSIYEELLELNKNAYGIHSEEYERTSIRLSELCNLISMILLKKERFDLCLLFLKKAQSYCLTFPKQKAVTYNNYACYYRKTGKHRTALKYLEKALELEWKSESVETLADTYLNSCAVLSQLGRHDEALQYILFSITLLQEQLMQEGMNLDKERVAVLAIAYHNAAVQLEFLKRYEQSVATYEKAAKFAKKHLKQDHYLVQNLEDVFKNAQESKQTFQKKNQKRRIDPENQRTEKMKFTYKERPQTAYRSVKKGN